MNKWKKFLSRSAKWLLLVSFAPLIGLAVFHILDAFHPFPAERIRDALATQSPMIRAADGTLLSWTVDRNEQWRLPVRLADVSPHLVAATIAVEDKRFYSHQGIDATAAARAAIQNLAAGRRLSGASTLTMQTVRLLWPRPRTYGGKIIEAFRAVQLERIAGKEGVLELYFNLAPYGGNVVGAEAAARKYFGKSAANLSLGEASLLAGIPQSPSRLDPRRRPEAARRRRIQVLRSLRKNGSVRDKDLATAAREDTTVRAEQAAAQLGHFSRLVQSANIQASGVIQTTLIPDSQERIERLAREWATRIPDASGPAVFALRVDDGAVIAYVGNGGGRERPDWQIDAARMRRQSGSLLKPFLFADLAETGAVTPATPVLDSPGFWPEYAPQNMDRAWRGEMSAAAALTESRNLPAVRQLARLGPDAFARTLQALGLETGDPSRQGLAMALGVREQSLIALTNAYAALARLGEWRPVKMLRNNGDETERRIVWSPETAWLTLSALAGGSERPALVWKTGTGSHQRDAWAVALTPEWVVGVWCGRLRNSGGILLTGGEHALPLALAALDAVSGGADHPWPVPEGIDYDRICAASGSLPGWRCAELTTTAYNRRRPPSRVCTRCGASTKTKTADAKKASNSERFHIAEPRPGAVFVVPDTPDHGAESALIYFTLSPSSRTGAPLYWFVNGIFLTQAPGTEAIPWTAIPGSHRVVAVDSSGATATASFSVVGHPEKTAASE